MNTTTLILIGMIELFLIACMWIGTWKSVQKERMLMNRVPEHVIEEEIEKARNVRKRD